MPDTVVERRAAPAAPVNGSSSYRHHVFLSYSAADEDWVQDELLPGLRKANLSVTDYHDFVVGMPQLVNLENAVEQSRHTLVVLTPAWLEGEWTAFAGLLVGGADPAARARRLIPLMLQRCRPPRHIALLNCADFTSPARRGEEMARLLRGLTAGADASEVFPLLNEYVAEYARDGFQALADLTRVPEVKPLVVVYRVVFRQAGEQITVLANYKELHDGLHELQVQCYNLIVTELPRFPADAVAQDNLQQHEITLQDIIDRLRQVAGRAPYLANEAVWVEALEQGRAELRGALDHDDANRLKKAVRCLDRVLAVQPSVINTRLNETARQLPLPRLVEAMNTVYHKIDALRLPDADRVSRFEDGVEALGGLNEALAHLVKDHDQWQMVDAELRRIEVYLEREIDELEQSWPDLKRRAEPLYARSLETWADSIRKDRDRLDTSLSAHDLVKIKSAFRNYRRRALDRFFRVDDALNTLCGNLRRVGEPLAAVLELIA